jgi:hypothetical protein
MASGAGVLAERKQYGAKHRRKHCEFVRANRAEFHSGTFWFNDTSQQIVCRVKRIWKNLNNRLPTNELK